MSRKTTNKMWNHQRNSQVWNRDTNNNQVFNHDTHLCVDLKTILRHDASMQANKDYPGVLRRELDCDDYLYDEHFTFLETVPAACKRNPRVFEGKYITITRRDDGSYHPNFRPIPRGEGFSLERYALGVYNEICMALEGLIEEE